MKSREQGKVSIGGILLVIAAVAAIYGAVMYLPVLTHRMSIGDVAREAAAKMGVMHDEIALREWIFTEVKKRTGVQVGTSEMILRRGQDGTRSVTVKWKEQVKHLWGTNHVIKMEVTEAVTPGTAHMKNAE